MLRLRQILQMLGTGIPQVEICEIVHCSKRTMSGYRKIASMTERSYEYLLTLSDSELEILFMPAKVTPNEDNRRQELDRMMPEIIKRLGHKHANIQFVLKATATRNAPTVMVILSSRSMSVFIGRRVITPITTSMSPARSDKLTSRGMPCF